MNTDNEIETKHRAQMNAIAKVLDEAFNGALKHPHKTVGVVLLVFPFGDAIGRANYISNGVDRRDMARLFREMAARFEGMPTTEGRA